MLAYISSSIFEQLSQNGDSQETMGMIDIFVHIQWATELFDHLL